MENPSQSYGTSTALTEFLRQVTCKSSATRHKWTHPT